MSFRINWPKFSKEFLESAQIQLTEALNKGDEKPPNIVDKIIVQDLYMGAKPPDLEILEIGELSEERFKGVFKLNYSGDGYIVMRTKVQANPLNEFESKRVIETGKIYAANRPLVVPMQIKISNVKLRGVIVLVVDKHKGVTLVFKNDPLEKVDVNSTFDNIPNIKRLLQRQIEAQLRKTFQNDLPKMVHQLSILFIQQQHQKAKQQRQQYHSYDTDHHIIQSNDKTNIQQLKISKSASQLNNVANIERISALSSSIRYPSNSTLANSKNKEAGHDSVTARTDFRTLSPKFTSNRLETSINNTSVFQNRYTGRKVLTDDDMIKRPHNEKWSGNPYTLTSDSVDIYSPTYFDPDMEGNVVLHRPTLSVLSPKSKNLGLKDILGNHSERSMMSNSVSRAMTPSGSFSEINQRTSSAFVTEFSRSGARGQQSPLKQSILGPDFNDALMISTENLFENEATRESFAVSPLLDDRLNSSNNFLGSSTSFLNQKNDDTPLNYGPNTTPLLYMDQDMTNKMDHSIAFPYSPPTINTTQLTSSSVSTSFDFPRTQKEISAFLDPSKNETAAHLKTLCRMYLTLSPREEENPYATFRSSPSIVSSSLSRTYPSLSSFRSVGESDQLSKRRVIRLKIPFQFKLNDEDKSFGIPSSSSASALSSTSSSTKRRNPNRKLKSSKSIGGPVVSSSMVGCENRTNEKKKSTVKRSAMSDLL